MNNKKNITIIPKYRFSKYKNAENWELLEFGNVFNFMQTNCFARVHMNNKEGIVRNIHYGDILIKYPTILKNESSIPFLNKDVDLFKFKRNSYVKNGDIIIADTAEDLTAGKAIEVQNINGDILAGLHTFLCRPKFVHSPMFLGYYLNSQTYHNKLKPFLTGVKVYSISKGNIIKTPIARPKDIGEQKKIAECLNSIDELIAGEEDKLKELKNHKKGLLQKLFPKNNSSNPELRFPEFKEDWQSIKLKDISIYQNGTSYENQIDDKGNFYLITLNSLDIEGNLKQEHKKIKTPEWVLNKDDLVMVLSDVAHGNFLGLTDIIPENDKYVLNQRMALLRIKKDYNVKFIRYYINHNQQYFKSIGQGSSQKNLAKDAILNFDILNPSKKEQDKISECLSSISDMISAQIEKIEALKLYKKGLMQGLFPSLEEVKDES